MQYYNDYNDRYKNDPYLHYGGGGGSAPYDRYGNFEFWKAVGCVIGGFAVGYITAVPTYAFSSFVNDTAENKATLLRIEKHLKQTNSYIDNINKHIAEEKKQQNSEE